MNQPSTSDIAFTPSVKAAQERRGSRGRYEQMERRGGWSDEVTPELREFIAERDSLYLGTASADGQPYIQHRGGPRGFLKVLDGKTLALADFSGNFQYISVGNLEENPKAYLFLMDYPHRRRVKIWGTAEYVEGDSDLEDRLKEEGYRGRVERAIVFHVSAWDTNCPQHILPRYSEAELAPKFEEYEARIRILQAELQMLRG